MSLDISIYKSRVETGYLTTIAGGTSRGVGTAPFSAATAGGGITGGVVRTTGAQRAFGIKTWDASANFVYDISIGGNVIERGSTLVRNASIGDTLYYSATGFLEASIGTQDPSIFDYVTVNESLIVVGSSQFNGINTFDGRAYFNNYITQFHGIYVTGSTQLDSTLRVASSTTLNHTLRVPNDKTTLYYLQVDDSLNVIGPTTLNTLVVSEITERGSHLVREASLGSTLYWESGLLEASVGTTINTLNDIDDVSIVGISVDEIIKWDGTNWINTQLDTIPSAFEDLTDVSVRDVSAYDSVMYDYDAAKWRNTRTVEFTEDFYTKTEVDTLLQQVAGGTY